VARSRSASAFVLSCVLALGATACGVQPAPVAAPAQPKAEVVGEFVNGAEAPVLGAPSALHLYLRTDRSLVAVDLDTGHISTAEVDASYQVAMRAVPGGAYVAMNAGYLSVASDLTIRARATSGWPDMLAAASTWSATLSKGSITLDEIALAGATGRTSTLLLDNDGLNAWEDFDVAGVIGNEVVLGSHGRIILVDLDAHIGRLWAVGSILAVGGGRIAWTECSTATSCQVHAGTSASPRAATLESTGLIDATCGPYVEGTITGLCPIAISANGRVLVGRDGSSTSLATLSLWDLGTGERRSFEWPGSKREPMIDTHEAFGVAGVAMSPDGSWLFAMQKSGRITAVEAATDRVVEFDVFKPLDDSENVIDAFAVS
jgi:hypothetical protein